MRNFTFAIGDIHGRLDLLQRSAEEIHAYLAENNGAGRVIFLGDYVDRGPDSRGVIEFLMRAQAEGSVTCLKGNHEDLMLKAVKGGDADMWLMNGGHTTLASYGGRFEDVPQEHIDWLEALPVLATDEQRIYVHAGLFPEVELEEQDPETCMWIRGRFLRHTAGFAKHVVHGHTHTWTEKLIDEPELLPHRTNLDTGAFHTGVLSVAVFDDSQAQPLEVLEIRALADGK